MAARAKVGRSERSLLKRVTQQADKCLAWERRYSKRRRALRQGAAMLRRGQQCAVVLSWIQEQIPEAVVTVPASLEEE